MHASFEVDTSSLDAVLRHVVPHGVRSLTSTPPTLEALFLRHYGDQSTDDDSVADRQRAT